MRWQPYDWQFRLACEEEIRVSKNLVNYELAVFIILEFCYSFFF